MSASRPNRAELALASLINVPDSVLAALSHDRDYRTAILQSPLPFSDDLFTHLFYEANHDGGKGSLKLLKRHLSTPQRRLVLENDTREVALEDMLDCNVLTYEELDLVLGPRHPDCEFDTPVSEKLFDYYVHDEVTMEELLPHLETHYRNRVVMRLSTSSDASVLRAVRDGVADLERFNPSDLVDDLEAMLYLRPHLAVKVAENINGHVHCMLANTRHAAFPGVLRVLRKDHSYVTRALPLPAQEAQVANSLKVNVFLPPVLSEYGTYNVHELPVSVNLKTVVDPIALERALRYATASYDPFKKRSANLFEIYDLAFNDHVAKRKDSLGRRWDGHLYHALTKQEAVEQLGPTRVNEALQAIAARFDIVANAHSYLTPLVMDFVAETPTRLVLPMLGPVPCVNLNGPVEALDPAGHLDATPLLALLGDSVGRWTRFFQYLDLAAPNTTVAKVTATAVAAST